MKTDRRLARELCMQALYQIDVSGSSVPDVIKFNWVDTEINNDIKKFASGIIKGTVENLEVIDSYIEKTSTNWKPDRISYIDKAILRFSIYSLLFSDVPRKVTIDEAIEIAKEYGDEKSFKFINGILDAIKKTVAE